MHGAAPCTLFRRRGTLRNTVSRGLRLGRQAAARSFERTARRAAGRHRVTDLLAFTWVIFGLFAHSVLPTL